MFMLSFCIPGWCICFCLSTMGSVGHLPYRAYLGACMICFHDLAKLSRGSSCSCNSLASTGCPSAGRPAPHRSTCFVRVFGLLLQLRRSAALVRHMDTGRSVISASTNFFSIAPEGSGRSDVKQNRGKIATRYTDVVSKGHQTGRLR